MVLWRCWTALLTVAKGNPKPTVTIRDISHTVMKRRRECLVGNQLCQMPPFRRDLSTMYSPEILKYKNTIQIQSE
jgi:hypothetical protein